MFDEETLVRYAALQSDDVANGTGFSVSFWTQGCPFKCKGCHNPQTWDPKGGIQKPYGKLLSEILSAICANDIVRNFSVLGGEPLCPDNLYLVDSIISKVREEYPNIKIYLWTGYILEDLIRESNIERDMRGQSLKRVLENIDVMIDGQFYESKRNTSLQLRGSTNQRILYKGKDF